MAAACGSIAVFDPDIAMTGTLVLCVAFVALAGCATMSNDKPADEAQAVCHREYRLGSNLPTTVCDTPVSEAERQKSVDALRSNLRPNVRPGGSGG